jgi:hypothetical protein
MQNIDYKQKYLKYKAKYLELKRGGAINKKITFAEIEDIFKNIKKKKGYLYYLDNSKEILDITQQKYDKSNESKKGNYYLKIKYRVIEYKDNNPENGEFVEKDILIDENNLTAGIFEKTFNTTYNVEIKPSNHNNYILYKCPDNCTGTPSKMYR